MKIIVYQFGKVGSTSVVNSLNSLRDVEAYQSHFLGEVALTNVLRPLLSPTQPDYLISHGERQLLLNLRLTREVTAHLRGLIEDELVIISIVREPVDWFRSQLVQEFPAYSSGFVQLQHGNTDHELSADDVKQSIQLIKGELKRAFKQGPHISNNKFKKFINRELIPQIQEERPAHIAEILILHIRAFMRPFFWFRDAVQPVFGFGLSDIVLDGSNLAKLEFDWGKYFIFRYEELSTGFTKVAKELGLGEVPLLRENVSYEKRFAEEIKEGFSNWIQDQEFMAMLESEYTRTFRYL